MGALWKIFKEALDLPKGEQYDDSSLMDISPPEFENWSPTERMRKRLPLKYQPEDDDSLMFFEKGLHQTINTPESERPLTPYGSQSLAWQSDMFDEDENGVFWYNPRSKKDMQEYKKELNAERKHRQLLLEKELPNILKSITYQELPEYVRGYFEQEFGHIFKQVPEAYKYVTSLTIDMRLHHGKYGDWAEYFKDDNRIEFYKEWHWDTIIYKLMDSAGIENPEEVRKYFINKYLNRTVVHELVHSLQHYFETIGTQHHFVAPSPQEEHPDYYKHQDFYKQDPGEIQAYDVGDSFEYPEDVTKQRRKDFGFNKYYSLGKSSWKTRPKFIVDVNDATIRAELSATEEEALVVSTGGASFHVLKGHFHYPGYFTAALTLPERFSTEEDAFKFAYEYACSNGIGLLLLERQRELFKDITGSLKFADPLTYTDKSDVSDGEPFKDRALMFHTEEATDIDNPTDNMWIEQEPNFFPAPSNENEIAQLDRDDNTILNNENKRKKTLTWKLPTSLAIPRYIWTDMNALKENLNEYLFEPGGAINDKVMMLRSTWDNTGVSKGMIGRLEEVFLRKGRNELASLLYNIIEGHNFFDSNYQELATDTTLWEAAIEKSERALKALKTITDSTVPGGLFDLESSLKLSSDDPSFDDYDNRDNTRHRNDFFKYDTDQPGGEDALDRKDLYYEDLMYKKDTEKEQKERNALDWTGRENLQLGFGSLKLGWLLSYTPKIGDRVRVEHPEGDVIINLVSEDPIDEPDRGLMGQVLESENPYWNKYQMFYLPKDTEWPVTKIASLKQSWKIQPEPKFMKAYRFYITWEEFNSTFADAFNNEDEDTIVQINGEQVVVDNAWADFTNHMWDIVNQAVEFHKLPAEVEEADLQDYDDEGKTCDIEVIADAKTHTLLYDYLLHEQIPWFKSSHIGLESSLKLSWNTFLSRIGDIQEGDTIIDDGNDKYRIKEIDYDRKMILLEEVFSSGNFDGPFWISESDMQEHGFEKVSFQKEGWGSSRRIWVSYWVIRPDKQLNTSDVQQSWTVVTPLLEQFEGIDQITGLIKEKLRNHLKKEYPDAFTQGYFWGDMRMWALNSENIEFLDKYFTEEEIKKLKEDTILIVDKKSFPVEVHSPLTGIN